MTDPKLWNSTDLVPGRPTRFVRVTEDVDSFKLALSIHCPSCPAKPHYPCLPPTGVGFYDGIVGFHETRVCR
jgi:hypothetical protein